MSSQTLIENEVWYSVEQLMKSLWKIHNRNHSVRHHFNFYIYVNCEIKTHQCEFKDNVAIQKQLNFRGSINYAQLTIFEDSTTFINTLDCRFEPRSYKKNVLEAQHQNVTIGGSQFKHLQQYQRPNIPWDFVWIRFINYPSFSTTKQEVVEAFQHVIDSNESLNFANMVMDYL